MGVACKQSTRRWSKRHAAGVFWLPILFTLLVCRVDAQILPLGHIKLPPGFEIGLYTSGVENARSMTLSPNGTLFVGTRSAGNVYAIVDRNKDHQADEVITLAQGLNSPNGVAFRDGALYVAEVKRVLRFDDVERRLTSSSQPVVVNDEFPTDRHGGWKFIGFGPDGRLYVPIGAPCNSCARSGPLRRDYASAAGRNGLGDFRPRCPQHGGVRLAPHHQGSLVHR